MTYCVIEITTPVDCPRVSLVSMNILEENSARYFRVQSEREQTFSNKMIILWFKNVQWNVLRVALPVSAITGPLAFGLLSTLRPRWEGDHFRF